MNCAKLGGITWESSIVILAIEEIILHTYPFGFWVFWLFAFLSPSRPPIFSAIASVLMLGKDYTSQGNLYFISNWNTTSRENNASKSRASGHSDFTF